MQADKKNLSDTSVQLHVVADSGQLKSAKKAALEHLGKDMRLPGFRQGKAPLNLVEKNANQATLQSEVLDRALNTLYAGAVQEHQLRPVAQPKVEIKKFVPFETLELHFEVEVVGDITLPDYKKIKKAKPEVKVTAKDIEEVIKQLLKREAEKTDVDRAAKKGDLVWLDFKGTDHKTKDAIPGADGKDYPLALGSNTFIPGFEDNLIGVKKGDEKSFSITFPADYGVPSLQKRKVDFAVTVHKVQVVAEPKLDDAFAAKVGPFKTVAELKADIKKQLQVEKQQQSDREYTDSLLMDITGKATVAIPAVLIDEQVERLVNEQKQNLVYRGQTWPEFLEEQGLSEEAYRAKLRPDAGLRVKAGLVLSDIAEAEKITLTPEELDARMQLLKGQYPDAKMQAELSKPEARRDIASRMISEKTIDKLVAHATK